MVESTSSILVSNIFTSLASHWSKFLGLRKEMKDQNLQESSMEMEEDISKEDAQNLFEMKGSGYHRANPHTESVPRTNSEKRDFMCKVCVFTASTSYQLRKHSDMKHPQRENTDREKEQEFNCVECDYQGHNEAQLRKHISLKHMIDPRTIKCRMCDERFHQKWDLMLHRKTYHIGAVAPCRKFANNECGYTDVSCWWRHTDPENVSENMYCFVCAKLLILSKK